MSIELSKVTRKSGSVLHQMASDQSEPTPLEAVSPEPSPHVVDVIGPSSNNDITVATTVVPPEDNTETKTEEPHAETVSEAPQAPNHNLSPLLPLNLVQHKRHSSTHSGYIANVVQGEQKTLRIEPVNSSVQAGPENAPAPAPPPASNIYLSSAFQSSIRNRSGDEFTLVLKYRFAAQDSAQKELWLHYFAALGLVVRCASPAFPLSPSTSPLLYLNDTSLYLPILRYFGTEKCHFSEISKG